MLSHSLHGCVEADLSFNDKTVDRNHKNLILFISILLESQSFLLVNSCYNMFVTLSVGYILVL